MGATTGRDLEEEVESIERPGKDGCWRRAKSFPKGAWSRLGAAPVMTRIQTRKEDEVWQ